MAPRERVLTVAAARLSHPDGVTAYRIERGGLSVVYATDFEHGTEADDLLVELAKNADVLIYDAMYTDTEYAGTAGPSRKGWGHSTWQVGVQLAQRANVGRLVLFHHDPSRTDEGVAAIEQAASSLRPGTVAAREGLEIVLRAPVLRAA